MIEDNMEKNLLNPLASKYKKVSSVDMYLFVIHFKILLQI
jgi:hypothetical protein